MGEPVTFVQVIEVVGKTIDAAGVTVIVIGTGAATLLAADRARRRMPETYRRYRQQLGRSILLGLELLVAADIIRTVAVAPTLKSVVLLAGIVLIRTFLSFSLELEITGRWPWQKPEPASSTEGNYRQSFQNVDGAGDDQRGGREGDGALHGHE